MASPFVPFSGGDFLPPAPTSGGMADDEPPPCSRCGFGGCDLRVAGCGCLLHTVSTPVFPRHVETGTNPTCASFFPPDDNKTRTAHLDMGAAPDRRNPSGILADERHAHNCLWGGSLSLGSCVDASSCTSRLFHGLMTCSTRCHSRLTLPLIDLSLLHSSDGTEMLPDFQPEHSQAMPRMPIGDHRAFPFPH